MLFLICGLIVGLAIVSIWLRDDLSLCVLIPLACIFTSCLIMSLVQNYSIFYMLEEHSSKIVSLKSDNQLKGDFFIGCGKIKDIEYYFMYSEIGKNQFKRIKIPVENCMIEESDTKSPKIKYTNRKYNFWLMIPFKEERNKKYDCKIIVPKNTIIRQYKLQ